jgi:hypothetical protein
VSTASPQLGSTRTFHPSVSALRTGGIVYHLDTSAWTAPREMRLLLCGVAEGGTMNILASTGYPIEILVTDVGLPVEDSGIDYSLATPPTTRKSYVTTWKSNGWAMYRSSGARKTNTDDIKQGWSSYDGDARGLWTFPSVTSALSGATVSKIEVYLYANHWYWNSGGTARVKVHGYSTIPGTLGGTSPMTHAIDSTKWPKPGGRWVTLPSSLYAGFKSGTYRGVGVGPAGTTNLLYYGRFNPGAQLRITYIK